MIKNRLLALPLFRKICIRFRNRIKLQGNRLVMNHIGCSQNDLRLNGHNTDFVIHDKSFIRDCKIHIEGDSNLFAVQENTELYGESNNSVYICGDNNTITIGRNVRFRKVSFFIRGSGNRIIIEDNCTAYNVQFHIEQDGNEIRVGSGTTMHGRDAQAIHLAADEGTKILVGEDCMFAHSTQMRSTDSHSIVDLQGKRLNPAKDIVIGKHCWIGLQCIILKGTHIPEHCIAAAGAVCSKAYGESHCVLAGNPARIVKRDVDWDRKFV